jgi:excinuclease ABC subunit A
MLKRINEKRNNVFVVEYDPAVIRNADYVIDLGPEGGSKGGELIAEGTPEIIAENKCSYTGQYIRQIIR